MTPGHDPGPGPVSPMVPIGLPDFRLDDVPNLPRERTNRRRARCGVIVDLDDTLYGHEAFIRSGFAAVASYVAAASGIDAGDAFAQLVRLRHTGSYGRELQSFCDRQGMPRELAAGLLRIVRAHQPALTLNHGASPMLRRFRQMGWRIVVLTNGNPVVQSRKIDALGVRPLVDGVIFADACAPGGKPSPEAFRAALTDLDVTANRCVSVGDSSLQDIEGARRLGMHTIRVARPGVVPIGRDADLVVDSLEAVPVAAQSLLAVVAADVA